MWGARYVRLIPWTLHSGSEHYIWYTPSIPNRTNGQAAGPVKFCLSSSLSCSCSCFCTHFLFLKCLFRFCYIWKQQYARNSYSTKDCFFWVLCINVGNEIRRRLSWRSRHKMQILWGGLIAGPCWRYLINVVNDFQQKIRDLERFDLQRRLSNR